MMIDKINKEERRMRPLPHPPVIGGSFPALADLLSDPVTQAVMQADGVTAAHVWAVVERVMACNFRLSHARRPAVRLRNNVVYQATRG
jgi:hypothetical protein